MRVRKKKHCAERLAACSEYIIKNSSELGHKPYLLEIGCGKGAFIAEAAQREPEQQFLAMEKVPDVLVVAAEKVKALGLSNVKFILGDASRLPELLGEHEVSRIHINFPDPWPRKKHFKRRLTYREFLDSYKRALVPGGEIRFKTTIPRCLSFRSTNSLPAASQSKSSHTTFMQASMQPRIL